jgi:hypothetical protein
MEKGKITQVKNILQSTIFSAKKLFDSLIAKVHFLDPKDNTKQRVVTALILIPIALYAIFYSKSLQNGKLVDVNNKNDDWK